MDLQLFNTLVTQMQSPDNATRSAAEQQYDTLSLPQKAGLLFQLFQEQAASLEARTMCLVLLRRLLANDWDELWPSLDAEHQKGLTDNFLAAAMSESMDAGLRKKIADVLAEIARNTIDEDTGVQKWMEIINFMEACNNTNRADLKNTAMILIESVPNIFGADQDRYLAGIKILFETCLIHELAEVRSNAVKAYVAFVCDNDDDDKLVRLLAGSVPTILQVCRVVADSEEDDDSPLQCLADLASTVPKILTPHLNATMDMCIGIVKNPEKECSYRHSAMEVITSYCEMATNTIKKRGSQYIKPILESALLLMCELEDDIEEWLAVDDSDEIDDEDTAGVGESSLDRIACALNGKVVLKPFQDALTQLMQSPDWKARHAGLMGVSTIGEGCQRQMEPVIDQYVTLAITYLKDEHPRVRYAACNALGQMCTDFAPTLQKKCHEKVIRALLESLVDLTCPRVSAHAGAALVNFSEDCPKQVMSSYLPEVMAKLKFVLETTFQDLINKGKKLVVEQVITTIASVADAAQDLFAEYYATLMPPLIYILQHSEADSCKTLRGKTIECISLIGLAVGKDMFAADAANIMNILSGTMPTLSPDDPQCSYMISSWTRICKVLGPDFAPYLPMVMDPVVRAASYNPQVSVLDEGEVESDDPAWSYHPIGDNKSLGIRTSGLEEKATACEMIVCYARELKEAFVPYVDDISKLVIGHLKFLFHDSVRSSAAETFPHLLECVKYQGVEAMRRLWVAYLPALVDALKSETDSDCTAEFLSSIAECITQLGPTGINGDELLMIQELMKSQMEEYEQRRKDREAQEADEDADPEENKEELDDEVEQEAQILSRISDLVHAGFETFGENFFGVVEPLLPVFLGLIDPKRIYADRQWGICIFDDLVEFAPRHAAQYQPQFIPPMLKALSDEFPEVRQAAAYGFGIMAMNGGPEFLASVTASLEPLAQMISKPDARSTEEGTIATENAIAAVAKILKYAGSQVDITLVIPQFLSWLPTHDDREESPHIYGYFCDLVESNHPTVLGPENSNLPKILDIVVSAFHLGAFEEDEASAAVKQRLRTIAISLKTSPIINAILETCAFDNDKLTTLQQIVA